MQDDTGGWGIVSLTRHVRHARSGRIHRVSERPGPHRGFFDLWSRFYDLPLVQRITYRPEHDAVLRRLRRMAHRRVLDLGCGTGLLAGRIARELPAAEVVGCDFSRGMLEKAARNAPAVRRVQGSATRLPFRDESFDAVVSTEAFHWFPDQHAALRELHRVLAPKGRLLVSFVNPPFEVMSRAGRLISGALGEPAFWPTRGRLRRRAEAAGFQVESQRLVLRVPGTLLLPSVLTVARRLG
jgi:ubiquinone/menaquinone biosynthesis C-methylase UbiE